MKNSFLLMVVVLAASRAGWAQVSGNANYSSSGSVSPEQSERSKRLPTPAELRPDNTATFIDAGVLMNVEADEYVAVFGVAQTSETVAGANQDMDRQLGVFSDSLRGRDFKYEGPFVDFVTQNKIYGYRLVGNVAKEQMVGFELKKTVSIRFKEKHLLDAITLAAADAQIFDLVKVDYIVHDPAPIQQKLMEEAARIVKAKADRQQTLLGIKLPAPAQVVVEKPGIYFPTEQYSSYSAFESETIRNSYDNSKYTVQEARKGRTLYFDPLSASWFDKVFNPVVTEPVVQFTLYLKVKYELPKRK